MTKISPHSASKIEFGDFQTPAATATAVLSCLRRRGPKPKSIIEPTCGIGSFLKAAVHVFPEVKSLLGVDVNPQHVNQARQCIPQAKIEVANFFERDWQSVVEKTQAPILIVGNPPWVTASGLARRGSANLPAKHNFQGLRGLDAMTGKSNFDIAEWMLIRLIESASAQRVTIAMLVKTAVARKVLAHLWRTSTPFGGTAIYGIDAGAVFNVSVSACLFVCDLGGDGVADRCDVFDTLDDAEANHAIGWEAGHLVADLDAHRATSHLEADPKTKDRLRWRSGVKHDSAKIMEFRQVGHRLINGLGETPKLEPDFLYPLLKGSDVARGREPIRWMLVPQSRIGEETVHIRHTAPKTWAYLERHADLLDTRKSSIYRNRPRFSVFGVGDYTFTPWKVAICGLYKSLNFHVVEPYDGRPVVLDDTVYFLCFDDQTTARHAHQLLCSRSAQEFFRGVIFWDAKRPVTAEALNRLDLTQLGLRRSQAQHTTDTLFAMSQKKSQSI